MKIAAFALTSPILLLVACAAPPSDADVDAHVETNTVAPRDCRDALESRWGADLVDLPAHSDCGGSGGANFPKDERGGKTETCLLDCSSSYSECVDSCVERFPEIAPPPRAPSVKTTKTQLGALGVSSNGYVAVKYEPPFVDPNAAPRGECTGRCTTTFDTCGRLCAARK